MSQSITSLTVKNYKGVNGEITIYPEGRSLVVIAGANGAGKSSLIDGIEQIFVPGGIKATPKPIHEGAAEASAEVVTSKARLVRVWKKDGDPGTLSAYALDGAKYASGKDFVLRSTGGALFDPQAFVSLPEKDQRAALLSRVELPFDLGELDRKRAGVFEQRSDTNRTVKQLEGQLAGLDEPVDGLPEAEVSAADILAEHAEAREHNAKINEAAHHLSELDTSKERADDQVKSLIEQLEAARKHLADVEEERDQAYDAFRTGPELIDLVAITDRLTSVEQTNAKVRAAADHKRVAAQLAAQREKATVFTLELERIDKQKADALASAKFPIDGLSVDDEGITFEGVPFRQVNTAMQTTIAFDLATSGDPDLKLIVIKHGDELDADSLRGIETLANQRGYLVLTERDRDESRQIGFTVSGGKLVNA
jgi:hypothetical protein